MPSKTKKTSKKYHELNYKDLNFQIDYIPKGVKSSDDLCSCSDVIGQSRALESMKTGLNVESSGYNILLQDQQVQEELRRLNLL